MNVINLLKPVGDDSTCYLKDRLLHKPKRIMYSPLHAYTSEKDITDDPQYIRKLTAVTGQLILEDLGLQEKDKDAFVIHLDVEHFSPEEIHVDKVDDYIVVTCEHEERKDGQGFVSRKFVRRFKVPDEFLHKEVDPAIASDGVLSISMEQQSCMEKLGTKYTVEDLEKLSDSYGNFSFTAEEESHAIKNFLGMNK